MEWQSERVTSIRRKILLYFLKVAGNFFAVFWDGLMQVRVRERS